MWGFQLRGPLLKHVGPNLQWPVGDVKYNTWGGGVEVTHSLVRLLSVCANSFRQIAAFAELQIPEKLQSDIISMYTMINYDIIANMISALFSATSQYNHPLVLITMENLR